MNQTAKIICQAQKEGRKALLETEAKAICAEYCIPITKFKLVKTEVQAEDFAAEIGFPVVLKIVSPDVLHKSDVGGVLVNLRSAKEVKVGYQQILENVKKHSPKAKVEGILVQEMAPQSTEVIVGGLKDPQFGQTLMFGLGGIFVELLKDVTFRIAPITEQDAEEMITEVKAYPLLQGYRNSPAADIKAIKNILLMTSKLMMDRMEIRELDLNPVLVYEKGAKVVDARIILE